MSSRDVRIDEQHRVWEDWAAADPLWAILTDPARKGGRWDVDEFFAGGVGEIENLEQEIASQGIVYARRRALDFGCGVGRLTQPLAKSFDRCDGVDISETMVELARQYNKYGERCQYHLNQRDDLSLFEDDTFDLIYSTLVLQHNPPDIALRYVAEFVRVLAPGGVAVFDLTDSPVVGSLAMPEGSHRAQVHINQPPKTQLPGTKQTISVSVTNTSSRDWPPGVLLRVGNHWRRAGRRGSMTTRDDGRATLSDGLPIGHTITVEFEVRVPSEPGRYLLEVDLVEEHVCWFADRGSPVASVPVTVGTQTSLAERLRGRVRRAAAPNDREKPREPEPFAMNGVPRAQVVAVISQAGGVLHASRSAGNAGPEWLAYRYFVVKTEQTPGPA